MNIKLKFNINMLFKIHFLTILISISMNIIINYKYIWFSEFTSKPLYL